MNDAAMRESTSASATDPGATDGEVRIGMAALAVAAGNRMLVTIALGSCVAIVLWDERARIGGLAHVLLPEAALSRDHDNPARFPDTAVPALHAAMATLGATGPLTARLVGGASMFRSLLDHTGVNIGARNVEAARLALGAAGVALVGEDVGGEHGRSVYFHVGTGRVLVRSLAVGDRDV